MSRFLRLVIIVLTGAGFTVGCCPAQQAQLGTVSTNTEQSPELEKMTASDMVKMYEAKLPAKHIVNKALRKDKDLNEVFEGLPDSKAIEAINQLNMQAPTDGGGK